MTPNRQWPAPHFYLLGHAHAVLDLLLEAAIRPDDPTSQAATDPDFAAKRLGALFRLAFDEGLLQLPARGDGPPGQIGRAVTCTPLRSSGPMN